MDYDVVPMDSEDIGPQVTIREVRLIMSLVIF